MIILIYGKKSHIFLWVNLVGNLLTSPLPMASVTMRKTRESGTVLIDTVYPFIFRVSRNLSDWGYHIYDRFICASHFFANLTLLIESNTGHNLFSSVKVRAKISEQWIVTKYTVYVQQGRVRGILKGCEALINQNYQNFYQFHFLFYAADKYSLICVSINVKKKNQHYVAGLS